jgi:hypothetical protein
MRARPLGRIALLIIGTREDCLAWTPTSLHRHRTASKVRPLKSTSLSTSTHTTAQLEESIATLKTVLAREYASFFNPMETDYYSNDVSFVDPLTSLTGLESYQRNVDMLASRTLLGKILFRDAGILLHNIKGGEITVQDEVAADGSTSAKVAVADMITRWTLRMTVQVIPWSPTARFSGISVYKVVPGGPHGVMIKQQTDYWDSVNLQTGGSYQKVAVKLALQDFLGQLSPANLQAPSAAPELPYQLLRRGKDYEIRKYPSYKGVETEYLRRDDGYAALDAATAGKSPLAPALMKVYATGQKSMQWPLEYARPGESFSDFTRVPSENNDLGRTSSACRAIFQPEQVVAVGTFQDASLEPVVRRADAQLRKALERDGIVPPPHSPVSFAQYDAVFSVGQRRGEVWIHLPDGSHPW